MPNLLFVRNLNIDTTANTLSFSTVRLRDAAKGEYFSPQGFEKLIKVRLNIDDKHAAAKSNLSCTFNHLGGGVSQIIIKSNHGNITNHLQQINDALKTTFQDTLAKELGIAPTSLKSHALKKS